MAKRRTQQLVDNFGRPYLTVNVIAGPFTLSAAGVSTEVVVVRNPEDHGSVRSVIQVRSGARIGRVAYTRTNAAMEDNVRQLWEKYRSQYGEPEMAKRLQSTRNIPKTMAEVLK